MTYFINGLDMGVVLRLMLDFNIHTVHELWYNVMTKSVISQMTNLTTQSFHEIIRRKFHPNKEGWRFHR